MPRSEPDEPEEITASFPRSDGLERRRLLSGNVPLRDGEELVGEEEREGARGESRGRRERETSAGQQGPLEEMRSMR